MLLRSLIVLIVVISLSRLVKFLRALDSSIAMCWILATQYTRSEKETPRTTLLNPQVNEDRSIVHDKSGSGRERG